MNIFILSYILDFTCHFRFENYFKWFIFDLVLVNNNTVDTCTQVQKKNVFFTGIISKTFGK